MKRQYIIAHGFLLLCLAFVSSQAWPFPSTYDDEFKEAAAFLPPGTDWRLLKAQCYQESRLQPNAMSPVGARGLCQFMPGTWAQFGRGDIWSPEASIRSAALYMSYLYRQWSSPRPDVDRYMLALASYNAGLGNILQAQRRCGMPTPYASIIACLEDVTGRHAQETTGYVRLIVGKWYPALILGD